MNRPQTASGEEFKDAVNALMDAGFSNARALDLLTKRMELRDKFICAAVTGLASKYTVNKPEDFDILAQSAVKLADACMIERTK